VCKRTAALQKQALAEKTRATYGVGTKAFLLFCISMNVWTVVLGQVPPSDALLAYFVGFQSQTCSHSSLKTYLYGIRNWTLNNGFEFEPWTQRYKVYSAMRGVRRVFGDFVDRKLAVTPQLLLMIYNCMDLSKHNDAMLWCAMLVAFWGLFRKDNITVGKASAFNPRANLTRGDFSVKNGILWVKVRHSKTNQFQQRCHWVPLVAIPGSPLCPVTAVLRVFKVASFSIILP